MRSDDGGPHSATALVYETTEEARILLEVESGLADARHAAGEAAYFLSDAIEPDERRSLLALAKTCPRLAAEHDDAEGRATQALTLMGEAAVEVEEMLRGPTASSELLMALRALRRGIGELVGFLGLETNPFDPRRRGDGRPGLVRRLRPRAR
jgi:hypothetical protein